MTFKAPSLDSLKIKEDFKERGEGILDTTERSSHMEAKEAKGRFSGIMLTNARCRLK